MKTLFPDQLVRRPDDAHLHAAPIDIGDVVIIQPVDGPALESTVIFNTPFLGTMTYTADALVPAADADAAPVRVRLRFRDQHVHHVAHARDRLRAA